MAFLKRIAVEGLFGLYDHSVDLRESPPVTFLAGPNGVGKTTLLRLTHALLQADYGQLRKQEFQRLVVTSALGTLTAEPEETDPERGSFRVLLSLKPPRERRREATIEVKASPLRIPSFYEQVAEDLYLDTRTGRYFDADDLERRFAPGSQRRGRRRPKPPEWFDPAEWRTEFIETKRLDSLIARARHTADPHSREREEHTAPIDYYLEEVRRVMRDARVESARLSQVQDRSFVTRLLSPGGPRYVNEEQLRTRYSEVEKRASQLAVNGLLAESLDVLPKGKLNPTHKRVMRLFLDDFEAKMGPLEPVSLRLEQLRAIVEPKFLNKRMELDLDDGPIFLVSPDGHQIDADALSSGEQHELALMSRLLFNVPTGTTVLVDEPELSLHVSWQHRVLTDLTGIAELAELRFVLATHSTAIINGRWELMEELGPIDEDVEALSP